MSSTGRTVNSVGHTALAALVSALAALSLVACGEADGGDAVSPTATSSTGTSATPTSSASTSSASTTSTSTTSASTTSASTDPTTTSTSPGGASDTAAPTRLTTSQSEAFFVSPSGRISCHLQAAGGGDIRCDQLSTPFDVPQEVSDGCEFDTGTSMSASPSGPVVGCVSDVVGMQPATSQTWWRESFGTAGSGHQAVLPYGSSISVGDVVCESTRSHVRCAVGDSGFTISAQGYTTF